MTLYPVEIFGNRDHQDRRSPNRMIVTVWACASLGVLLLSLAVAHSSALPHKAALAGKASAPLCRGKAHRVRPAHVSFSFECGNEDVTAFRVQANRPLHFVYDPNSAFDCLRRTSRSFSCEDIHSGASSVGSGLATVSEPLCHLGAHLVLRITPALNFESTFRTTFTLRGRAEAQASSGRRVAARRQALPERATRARRAA
jgi:hypothetical protein